MYCSQMRDVIIYISLFLCVCVRARVSQNINDEREREKICFAFYAVCSFSCACEIFSIFPFLVFQKLARVALGHSILKRPSLFALKKPKNGHFFTHQKEDKKSHQSSFDELEFSRSFFFSRHKKKHKTHTKK